MLGREVMMQLYLMLGSDEEEVGRGSTFRAYFKDSLVDAHRKEREILEGVQRLQEKILLFEEENYNLRSRGCSIEEE